MEGFGDFSLNISQIVFTTMLSWPNSTHCWARGEKAVAVTAYTGFVTDLWIFKF